MSAKKKVVKTERILPTIGQLAELMRIIITIVTKIFKQLDRSTVQHWIGHERELTSALKTALGQNSEIIDNKVANWVKFYHEIFGLDLDPTEIKLPNECNGFNWLIVVVKGLTYNQVFGQCAKRFKSWRYYCDLDKAIVHDDRQPTKTYAVRVRNRVEADEEHRNKSANTISQAGIKGTTALERMLLELWYHWKTDEYLDITNVTICSGSRYADGGVPFADRYNDKFYVDNVSSYGTRGCWRVREVVS